ncbi:MAG: hypothetical protein JSR26_07190 [Proteobacteria bacterium]|nr:hypothetical protein [Pseudomonadota bacterium]
MNIYLIILVIVLAGFVLVVINRAMGKHDIPHPHHSSDAERKGGPGQGSDDNGGH